MNNAKKRTMTYYAKAEHDDGTVDIFFTSDRACRNDFVQNGGDYERFKTAKRTNLRASDPILRQSAMWSEADAAKPEPKWIGHAYDHTP